ncbi:MAG: hypothetical protein SPF89_02930 [Sphaerochaetaceae bacterium]|nr:hypothetical protein [Spirochaetales bacterium]MDY5499038.1 hypothetical protein [Sphaerochaetaceae bacterium]
MTKRNQQKQRKISLCTGLAAGTVADTYLRMTSGDEGNLLVHTAVFLVSAAIVTGIVYGGFWVWKRISSEN